MSADRQQIHLFNTLSKSKQAFAPLDASNVRMYVCGPTVYDFAHIGNARPAIIFDTLFRLLRHVYGQDRVTYVRNITDVDDKITARARRDHADLPLNEAIAKVTSLTEKQYQHDMRALGCLDPSIEPRATEHIGEMIEMTETLIANGHAYAAEGHVLFDVKSFKQADETIYGKLSRRSLDDMLAGARVEVAPYKRDPMDFVLWKPSDNTEPGWQSPWGVGRPGWHIECSAMAAKYLGTTFDIHGGGIDLSFPHHENELAQSCCAHQSDAMAQVWMHNGFLNVEGEKMSKSLGNFITVHELLDTEKFGDRKWSGPVLRLAVLMTNYREPIDFSVHRLLEAEAMLIKWQEQILAKGLRFSGGMEREISAATVCTNVISALSNDLNMPAAITELHRHAKGDDLHAAQKLYASLALLGLTSAEEMAAFEHEKDKARSAIDAAEIDALIASRLKALTEKDWSRADAIRDQVAAMGLILRDGKDPATGARTTEWEVAK